MLTVEDWARIRQLHRAEGMPIKVIARVMGISRNTVRAAIAADGPPKYDRPPAGSIVDEVEPQIRELLAAFPTLPATVIAERIGWDRSVRSLSGRVAELRPVYLPPDPASRTVYAAVKLIQVRLRKVRSENATVSTVNHIMVAPMARAVLAPSSGPGSARNQTRISVRNAAATTHVHSAIRIQRTSMAALSPAVRLIESA